MELKIPPSLKSEHNDLHAELTRATKVKGNIGESAKAVAKVLHPQLEEHRTIIASLKILVKAAKEEKEYVNFAEKLISHAKNEEEVLYPASLLVGEYLRLKGIEK